MRTFCGLLALAGLVTAAPAFALSGLVVDAQSRAPIANAEATVVGERGPVRTGPDGRFEWPLPARTPVVFVVILLAGRVARPIRIEAADPMDALTLLVEPAVTQAVDVSGTAPGIDVAAGASASLVTAADNGIRHPATLGQILENIAGVGVTAQTSRDRDDIDGTPIDDVAPRSVSLVARHSLRGVSSYLRIAATATHDAAGPSEVPTPGYAVIDAGAALGVGRHLQVLGTIRNLTDQAFYSSAGPRWVYARGRHGSLTLVVTF